MRCCVVIVAVAACGNHEPATASATPAPAATTPAPPAPAAETWSCDELPFEAISPVPEASGAAWLPVGLVVVSDSGNDGAYAILDPETGKTIEEGKLPLGKGSDDVEGLAARGDLVYGLTSAGWMRVWKRQGKGFALVDGPYPLGPVDLRRDGTGNEPPDGKGMICALSAGNCGRNYEGLALAHHPTGDCVGFAASKADGHLYCLTEKAGRFAIDRTRSIPITKPGSLADCAFGDDDALWAGSNFFDASRIYRIENWADPAHARVVTVGSYGPGFPEVVAARGDTVYRMSDTGASPSLIAKFRCTAADR